MAWGWGVSKWAYFCIQPSSSFLCLMYNPICLLYRVIQDFMQKALFSEIQAIRSGWGKLLQRCFRHANLYINRPNDV